MADAETCAAVASDFAFERYFLGRTRGHGILQDRRGGVRRRFTVDMDGVRAADGALRLSERLLFDDGEQLDREWTVRAGGDGHFCAWAEDVQGPASGETRGGTVRWRYVLRIALGGRQWHVDMDDWMYALPDDVVLSRTRLSKWGVTLASMTVTYRRSEPEPPR